MATKQIEQNIDEQIYDISKEVLNQSRNALFIRLRFLDLALGQFSNTTTEDSQIETYITDGKILKYNPIHIIKQYKNNNNYVSRNYLHIVLHCIFRHMLVSSTFKPEYWDLACDIAVENMITELHLDNLAVPEETAQQEFISTLKDKVKYVTAECIYYYIKDANLSQQEIKMLNKIFYVDSHELWYKQDQNDAPDSTQNNKEGISTVSQNAPPDSELSGNDLDSNNVGQIYNKSESQLQRQALKNRWEEISQRIQVDLETFSKGQGNQSGSMVQNLKEVNREKYDYTDFLKKFATTCEVMKINDDEFDYVYYTYGLSIYKNMPLIEPLEYKDVKRIKDFVIAIDTSDSVEGELVQTFLQKTYNILKSTESFYSKVNIHIIQCDTEIQEDAKITNQREFDAYLKEMQLHGFGGTDFRPVFNYIDKLIKEKEFQNLKGLIYFTDGWGTFPPSKPEYQTAFVFIDNDYNNYEVPSWAIKLILKDIDIL